MNKQTLIEEISLTDLEQRIEFGCCGGEGGGGHGPGCGPDDTTCPPWDMQ